MLQFFSKAETCVIIVSAWLKTHNLSAWKLIKNYNFLTQVMKTENGDKSVPITWAYNHHFEAYLSGSYSEMKQLSVAAYPFGHHNHGAPTFW